MDELEREIRLPDGQPILVREVWPTDAAILVDGFGRLSARSRLLRFLAPKNGLTSADLRYLTEIDHFNHEAFAALTDAGGQGIGIARYVRDSRVPDSAEVGIVVVDEWQGRGVGSALLTMLRERALDAGIARFTGLMFAGNTEVRALLRHVNWPVRWVRENEGLVSCEVSLGTTIFA
jgi:acetyltransferase